MSAEYERVDGCVLQHGVRPTGDRWTSLRYLCVRTNSHRTAVHAGHLTLREMTEYVLFSRRHDRNRRDV